MTISELMGEINGYQNDTSISVEEKKNVISIFKAEIERQKSDQYINKLKTDINNLRRSIVKDIVSNYGSYNEFAKDKAVKIVIHITLDDVPYGNFDCDTVENENCIVNDALYGTVYNLFDENVQQKLEQGKKMEVNLQRVIAKRFLNMEDQLSDILGENFFNFYKVDSDGAEIFNDREFFDKNFVSAKAKVDALNVEIRAKGILKNIVMDVTKYGITHGKTIENLPPLGIDKNKLFDELESQNSFDENEMNGKTM